MKKVLFTMVILLIILGLVVGYIVIMNGNKEYCYDTSHRGVYPVNPYCEKCGARDGIVMHQCTNPNGKEKYCRVCGKIVFAE